MENPYQSACSTFMSVNLKFFPEEWEVEAKFYGFKGKVEISDVLATASVNMFTELDRRCR